MEWSNQSATFRVLYRESGTPDYQVIVPTTSQLSHNISALQPNTLYNIVVEATHTVTQQKVNSSVTTAYTTYTPRGTAHYTVYVHYFLQQVEGHVCRSKHLLNLILYMKHVRSYMLYLKFVNIVEPLPLCAHS